VTATPQDLARTFVERERRRIEALEARRGEVVARLREVAPGLAERLGASRIYLFGSMAWSNVHEGSDVDIALEGIPADRHFKAWAVVEEELRGVGVEVEVVLLEELDPDFRERIVHEGMRLA
jgi:predicted nucleotidyltransferase